MRNGATGVITALLIFLTNVCGGQEKLRLSPERPKVGDAFKVMLDPKPTEGEYVWEITVVDIDEDAATRKAKPDQIASQNKNQPELEMKAPGPHLHYDFLLKHSKEGTSQTYKLSAQSSSKFLQTVAAPSDSATPSTPSAPAVAVPSPGTAPAAPTAGDLKKMNDRLNAARKWAEQIATLPKSDDLVLNIDFFQGKLAKRPDGKEGITEFAHRPLLDAAELHRAMYAAGNKFAPGTDADSFVNAWHSERRGFLEALVTQNAATPLIVTLWTEFIDAWEAEVIKVNKERFRDALLQAPLITTGLLLDFDNEHIKAALTNGPRGSSSATTSSSGGGYGTSHAAVHHARIMSRIHYRHERRMARIGY